MPLSPDCGHLYFSKQVFHPANYKVSGLDFQVQCQFSIQMKKVGRNWEQRAQTLAQEATLFSDRKTHGSKWHGHKVSTGGGVDRYFYGPSIHKLKVAWSTITGWVLNQGGIKIKLGARSLFAWGMLFLKEQLTQNVQFHMKISYYRIGTGFVNPSKPLEDSVWDFTVKPSDLDNAGVFLFKDTDDPTLPLGFVASSIWINKIAGPNLLNFDFVGTFYDYATAFDGKHSDNNTDKYNNADIGSYISKEDGSESIVNTNSFSEYTDAKSNCLAKCAPTSKTATKVYAGTKMISFKQFKCKCFTRETNKLIGWPGSGLVGRSDPRFSMLCDDTLKNSYINRFNGDTGLINFFKSTTPVVSVTPGAPAQVSSTEKNICDNQADVGGFYMAQLLGLNVGSIATNYKYDTSKSRTFPKGSSGPSTTFVPSATDETRMKGLTKAFWTIMDQYTASTEPGIRNGRTRMWCHFVGVGVYHHCLSQLDVCDSLDNQGKKSAHCKTVWEYFMQICNRVRSLDPNHNDYKLRTGNPNFWCLSNNPSEQTPAVSVYYIYSSWNRACPEMEDKIYEMSNNTLGPEGWLELKHASTGFNKKYRVPGTTMKYKCSTGYDLEDESNPYQEVTCQASRKVDFSNIKPCKRKFHLVSVIILYP